MRPLHLTIKGLASFRREQEVDFEGLDLFVIMGPTGAGKTTILDAVALALYGEIPRTGKRNAAELVSHGDTRARVQLEFRADGETYRVSRVLPRNGAQTARLERRAGDDWLLEVEEGGVRPVNARIEAIVGLDFDAFTRAVLLPQGEFARFLAGDARQRREILVRLLELGRYERAGQLARQEADGLRAEVASREELVAGEYADVDDAAVAAATEAATRAVVHAEAVVRGGEEIERLASSLGDLEQRLAAIARDAAALGRTRQALTGIAESWADLEPRAAQADKVLLRAKAALDDALVHKQKAEARLEEVRLETGGEAELAALAQACWTRAQERDALAGLETAIAAAEHAVGELNREHATAGAEVEDAKRREEAARVTEDDLRRAAEQATRAVQRASERAAAEKAAAEVTAEKSRWQAELETRLAARGQLERAVQEADDHLRHLRGEHAAIDIRVALTVGEPCPVCLQPVRSIPPDEPGIASAIGAAEAALPVTRHELSQAQRAVAEAESEIRVTARRRNETDEALARLANAPPLERAEAEAGALNAKRDAALADRAAAAEFVRQAMSRLGELAARLAGAIAERGSCAREHAGCKTRLRDAEATLKEGFPAGIPEDAADAIGARRATYEAARNDEAAARKVYDATRDSHGRAAASREGLERQAATLRQRCAEQRGVLGQVSATRDMLTLAEIAAPREAVGDEVTVLGAWREAVTAELDRLRDTAGKDKGSQAAALRRELATMGLSDAPGDLSEVTAKVKKAIRDSSLEASRAADKALALGARLKRRREFEAQIAQAREREQLYRALADELRQNRFIDFLLGESISQLASLASAELRGISGGRYGLIAKESGFAVVDHANADETRSVDTLSGGETFLAALSLATALAGSITDIAGEAIGSRLEAMFIDEGFGTLDVETLDAVIDALERLRDSERLVGVITHVSQLAERIPDGLVVEREGTSSRVRPR